MAGVAGKPSPGARRAGSSWRAPSSSPGAGRAGPARWRGAARTGWSRWPSALLCAGPAPRTVAWCRRCARSSLSQPSSPLLERKNTQSQTLCCGHPLSSPKSKTRQGLLGVGKEDPWGRTPLLPGTQPGPEQAQDNPAEVFLAGVLSPPHLLRPTACQILDTPHFNCDTHFTGEESGAQD